MNPSLSDIKNATVAFYASHRITREDLEGPAHAYRVSHPRQVAMYLARALTSHSLPRIGKSFGGRHHTTVLLSVRAVENRQECLADAEKIRQALERRAAKWGEFSAQMAACRSIAAAVIGLIPPPPPVRDWLLIASEDAA